MHKGIRKLVRVAGAVIVAAALASVATAGEYRTRVVAAGLERPTGIAAMGSGTVYFTEVPTPGVPGTAGGRNGVRVLTLGNGAIASINDGEPEPVNLAVGKGGQLYWTCKSAGVILRKSPAGVVSLLLSGLDTPVGIAIDHKGKNLFWTEVPTPGVSGSHGGRNSVQAIDLDSMERSTVDVGDPEPTDITVARNGNLYWTCSSAGVIVEAEPRRH